MAQNQITPRQFLTQIAYKTSSTLKNLCDFQNVKPHADDEKIDVKDYLPAILRGGGNDDDEEEGAVGGSATECCSLCLKAPCTVLFLNCKHLCICTPCYAPLFEVAKDKHAALTQRMYNESDNELHDIDIPPLKIECTMCRELHLTKDVISGIFRN